MNGMEYTEREMMLKNIYIFILMIEAFILTFAIIIFDLENTLGEEVFNIIPNIPKNLYNGIIFINTISAMIFISLLVELEMKVFERAMFENENPLEN